MTKKLWKAAGNTFGVFLLVVLFASVWLPVIVSAEEENLSDNGEKDVMAVISEDKKRPFFLPKLKEGLLWEGDSYRFRLQGNLQNRMSLNKINDHSLLNPNDIFEIAKFRNDTEATLKLDGNIKEKIGLFVRGRLRYEYIHSQDGKKEYKDNLDQAYTTVEFGDKIITFVSIGKQRIKWGPGFYWNPVDTFNPRQDLKDREKIEEGKICYRADVAFPSFSFTGVIVPNVDSKIFALHNFIPKKDHTLLTAKFNTFLWNTDLTFYISDRKQEDIRWGASFSTVISDIQFFGEGLFWRGESERSYLYLYSDRKLVFDSVGNTYFTTPAIYGGRKRQDSFYKIVLGLQYTFSNDLTIIAEYYHNQDGYSKKDMRTYIEFLRYVGDGYQNDVDSTLLAKEKNPGLIIPNYLSKKSLLGAGNSFYDFANLRKNYFHISASKPYVLNRFDLGIDLIVNIDDYLERRGNSLFLRPSITYTAIPNWRFTLYSQIYAGANETEFGMLGYNYSIIGVVKYSF